MIIGVPKEIKSSENRVALTPAGALEFTRRGHHVYVQATAGTSSGFSDEEYRDNGAEILATADEVWAKSDMIMKVKEPIAEEYPRCRANQLIFTYFHFASSRELTDAMLRSGAICLAYETVETKERQLAAADSYVRSGWRHGYPGRGQVPGKTRRWPWGVAGRCTGRGARSGAGDRRRYCGYAGCEMAACGAQATILDVSLPRLPPPQRHHASQRHHDVFQ